MIWPKHGIFDSLMLLVIRIFYFNFTNQSEFMGSDSWREQRKGRSTYNVSICVRLQIDVVACVIVIMGTIVEYGYTIDLNKPFPSCKKN